MIDRDYCVTMARYNRWMNERLHDACAGFPDADRRRDLGAFFRSIHGTLNHLLWGDRVWMSRFTGGAPPWSGAGDEICHDFDELRSERARTDAAILEWAGILDEAWLRAPFTWTSGVDGAARTHPAWVLVAHLFNHQAHHRGQLTTLMMQLGRDPGVTDLPWMPGLDQAVV